MRSHDRGTGPSSQKSSSSVKNVPLATSTGWPVTVQMALWSMFFRDLLFILSLTMPCSLSASFLVFFL